MRASVNKLELDEDGCIVARVVISKPCFPCMHDVKHAGSAREQVKWLRENMNAKIRHWATMDEIEALRLGMCELVQKKEEVSG